MLDRLYVDLTDGDLKLVKLTEAHREALRAAIARQAAHDGLSALNLGAPAP